MIYYCVFVFYFTLILFAFILYNWCFYILLCYFLLIVFNNYILCFYFVSRFFITSLNWYLLYLLCVFIHFNDFCIILVAMCVFFFSIELLPPPIFVHIHVIDMNDYFLITITNPSKYINLARNKPKSRVLKFPKCPSWSFLRFCLLVS